MIDTDFSILYPIKKYERNSRDCIHCGARNKLIISTPEELVRQATINFLIEQLKIPKHLIYAEVPMSYYKNGAKGRADIIVTKEDNTTLILIECKEKKQYLVDDVFEQITKYIEIVQPDYVMATNSRYSFFYSYNDKESEYIELDSFPCYSDLILQKNLNPKIEEIKEFIRPIYTQPIPEKQIEDFIAESNIGKDTPKVLLPFIFNFYGSLFDVKKMLSSINSLEFKLLEDKGIRFTQFGNAGGGSWPGVYRYFIIEDNNKNSQIISISIMGGMKTENDPHWGNRNSHSYLLGAIDDFEKSHLSIVLNLDKFIEIDKSKVVLWHDGTLTIGKKGRVKRSEVIDFIRETAPHLIINGRIILGEFDLSEEINMDQKNMKDFIANFISYLMLRDKYRKSFGS